MKSLTLSRPSLPCPRLTLLPPPASRGVRWLAAGAAAFLLSAFSSARAETWVLPTTGVWNVATNWTPQSVPNSVGAAAIFNSDQTAARTITYGQPVITVGSLTINNSTNFANTFGADVDGNALHFNADGSGPNSATLTVTGNSSIGGTPANPNAIRGPVVLEDDLILNVERGSSGTGDLTFLGSPAPGSSITGAFGITKNGTGIVTFADTAKAFSGPLVINAGGLRLNSTGRVTGTSSVTIASGARINLDGPTTGTANYTFGNAATTVMTINGTGFAAFPGAIRVEGSRSYQLDNPIVLQTASAINVGATGGIGGSLKLTNTVSGAGALTMGALQGDVSAQPSLILTAHNSYLGGTTITSGTLVVSGATADLGSGNVTVDAVSPGPTGTGSNGRLTIETGVTNAINDLATLSLTGGAGAGNADGGFVTLNSGVNEIVGGLLLAGVAQGIGTYGSTLSTAAFKNDEFFAGTGIVTVIPEPGSGTILLGSFSALLGLQRFRRRR